MTSPQLHSSHKQRKPRSGLCSPLLPFLPRCEAKTDTVGSVWSYQQQQYLSTLFGRRISMSPCHTDGMCDGCRKRTDMRALVSSRGLNYVLVVGKTDACFCANTFKKVRIKPKMILVQCASSPLFW